MSMDEHLELLDEIADSLNEEDPRSREAEAARDIREVRTRIERECEDIVRTLGGQNE